MLFQGLLHSELALLLKGAIASGSKIRIGCRTGI